MTYKPTTFESTSSRIGREANGCARPFFVVWGGYVAYKGISWVANKTIEVGTPIYQQIVQFGNDIHQILGNNQNQIGGAVIGISLLLALAKWQMDYRKRQTGIKPREANEYIGDLFAPLSTPPENQIPKDYSLGDASLFN